MVPSSLFLYGARLYLHVKIDKCRALQLYIITYYTLISCFFFPCLFVWVKGIVNGIDVREWDPSNDPHVAAPYSADDFSGKVSWIFISFSDAILVAKELDIIYLTLLNTWL